MASPATTREVSPPVKAMPITIEAARNARPEFVIFELGSRALCESGASVSILAGQAEIVGVELAAAATPLVQWP